MENALRTNPLDVREHYEKQLKDFQEAYGEAMLELRARTRPFRHTSNAIEKRRIADPVLAAQVWDRHPGSRLA